MEVRDGGEMPREVVDYIKRRGWLVGMATLALGDEEGSPTETAMVVSLTLLGGPHSRYGGPDEDGDVAITLSAEEADTLAEELQEAAADLRRQAEGDDR
jgi:hypothetical protein